MKSISPVRNVANALYHLTRALTIIYGLIAVYAISITILAKNGVNGLPLSITEGNRFTIYYPFTNTPFILVQDERAYLVTTLLVVLFYGLFLVLLVGVFDTFRQKKLFTPKGVQRLTRFYLANFLLPVIAIIILLLLGEPINDLLIITFLHIVLGIFIYFMTAIFRQGLVLQIEQDLTF